MLIVPLAVTFWVSPTCTWHGTMSWPATYAMLATCDIHYYNSDAMNYTPKNKAMSQHPTNHVPPCENPLHSLQSTVIHIWNYILLSLNTTNLSANIA